MGRCVYMISDVLQCREIANRGTKWCSYHRGAVPTGVDHHFTTHGRYSKDLPRDLMDRFIAAASDPDILSLLNDIALVDTRIGEVLGRIKDGSATSSVLVWDEIEDRLKLRQSLVESEQRRMTQAGMNISVAQLMMLLRSISVVIKAHVTDEVTQSRIAAGIADLIDASPSQAEYVGFEVIPAEKRRWSHTDDAGNPSPDAPIMPVENLDASINWSAGRNNVKNPVDPETGMKTGYNPTFLHPTRLSTAVKNPLIDVNKPVIGGTYKDTAVWQGHDYSASNASNASNAPQTPKAIDPSQLVGDDLSVEAADWSTDQGTAAEQGASPLERPLEVVD